MNKEIKTHRQRTHKVRVRDVQQNRDNSRGYSDRTLYLRKFEMAVKILFPPNERFCRIRRI